MINKRLTISIVALLVLVGVAVVVLDFGEDKRILSQTDWKFIPIALFFTAISYICISCSFWVTSRIFGIGIPSRTLSQIGFVSMALNHVITIAGIPGYSLRILLMGSRGVGAGDVVAVSLFYSYFNYVVFIALFLTGLIYLLTTPLFSPGGFIGLGVVTALLVLVLFLATILVFVRTMRVWFLQKVKKIMYRLKRDYGILSSINNFDQALARGMVNIQRKPFTFVLLLALVTADWISTIFVLRYCFEAFGDPIGTGVLITGFAIGIAVGLLSMIPGGLGIQEASMAGVYSLLGVFFERAVLASILFRVIYYFIPFGVSLPLYLKLVRTKGRE